MGECVNVAQWNPSVSGTKDKWKLPYSILDASSLIIILCNSFNRISLTAFIFKAFCWGTSIYIRSHLFLWLISNRFLFFLSFASLAWKIMSNIDWTRPSLQYSKSHFNHVLDSQSKLDELEAWRWYTQTVKVTGKKHVSTELWCALNLSEIDNVFIFRWTDLVSAYTSITVTKHQPNSVLLLLLAMK